MPPLLFLPEQVAWRFDSVEACNPGPGGRGSFFGPRIFAACRFDGGAERPERILLDGEAADEMRRESPDNVDGGATARLSTE